MILGHPRLVIQNDAALCSLSADIPFLKNEFLNFWEFDVRYHPIQTMSTCLPIDNNDSYTYSLYHILKVLLGHPPLLIQDDSPFGSSMNASNRFDLFYIF